MLPHPLPHHHLCSLIEIALLASSSSLRLLAALLLKRRPGFARIPIVLKAIMIRSGFHTIFTLFALMVFLTSIVPLPCFSANNASPKHCCPSESTCEERPKGEESKNCCVQKGNQDAQLFYYSGSTVKPLELSAAPEHKATGLSLLERSSPRPEEPYIPLDETYKFTCAYLI